MECSEEASSGIQTPVGLDLDRILSLNSTVSPYLEITGLRIHAEVDYLTLRFAQLFLLVPQTLGCAS